MLSAALLASQHRHVHSLCDNYSTFYVGQANMASQSYHRWPVALCLPASQDYDCHAKGSTCLYWQAALYAYCNPPGHTRGAVYATQLPKYKTKTKLPSWCMPNRIGDLASKLQICFGIGKSL